ncbi:MAG: hypothetical protein M3T96_03850 [Acidobacteriota bacterium]|nr:hypothetical protein [Acidobacteriota bacterium]
MNLENALADLNRTLAAHHEWLIVNAAGKSFAVQKREIELTLERGKIIVGFLDEKGFQLWRISDYKIEKDVLTLDVTRNFKRETDKIKFVPRISSAELGAAIERARLEKANEIARLLVAENPSSKLVRVALNKENGRFAEIVFEVSDKKRIAALSDVSETVTAENLLTTAILQSVKFGSRKKNPISEIWILAETKVYKNLRKLHALLRENWRTKIAIKEISRDNAAAQKTRIVTKRTLAVADLWREKPPKIAAFADAVPSRTATEIIKLAPAEIDVIFSKHGETARFRGLPFARVRRIGTAEKCWFGIERERRILNEETRAEFFDLLENLKTYRRFDAPGKRHALYTLASEAWLEAILRRDINLLDRNLILSPIHQQFRAGGDRIDLLALRKDGRLIIIEVKTQPDAQMVYQAADYWRKIELQRRSGSLNKAKIFGDLEIADRPALVFLVAPTLYFHYHLDFLAQTVAAEIEIYQFNLNENWRENLKVMKVREMRNEK